MLKAGQIVKSVAGHDKGKFYAVVAIHENGVMIANGKARKLAKPKAKNVMHVKKTNAALSEDMLATDRKLRKALAAYSDKVALDCGETEDVNEYGRKFMCSSHACETGEGGD